MSVIQPLTLDLVVQTAERALSHARQANLKVDRISDGLTLQDSMLQVQYRTLEAQQKALRTLEEQLLATVRRCDALETMLFNLAHAVANRELACEASNG